MKKTVEEGSEGGKSPRQQLQEGLLRVERGCQRLFPLLQQLHCLHVKIPSVKRLALRLVNSLAQLRNNGAVIGARGARRTGNFKRGLKFRRADKHGLDERHVGDIPG